MSENNLSDITQNPQLIKKRSLSGATAYFVRTLFLQALGFVSVIILGAILEPKDFGIYAFVTAIIGVLTFFSDIGLAASLIQKKEEPTLDEYRTAFTVQQILSWFIFLVCIVLVVMGVVRQQTGFAGELILISLALSFPLATFKTIPSIILERNLKFGQLTMPQIFEQLSFHGVLIFLVWSGFGVYSYVPAILSRSIIGVIAMTILQRWPIGLAIDKLALKHLVKVGAQFQLNDLLARIKDQLFVVALGFWLPMTSIGYVTFAKQWSLVPYQLTVQNIIAVTFSVYSRLQHDKELLRKAIEKTLYYISLITLPMIGLMIVAVYPVTQVIPKYGKWEPATWSLIFFSLNVACSALTTPFTNMLAAIGKVSITVKLMSFWTALTWILTPVLIYAMGYNGVAVAAFLVAFTSFITLFILKRHIYYQFLPSVWRQLVGVIVLLILGIMMQSILTTSMIWLFIGILSLALSYFLTVFLLGPKHLISHLKSLKA